MSEIEQYNACTSSGAKGSSSNPYSQVEFYELLDSGNWEGGYVTGMGYVTPEAVVGGSDSASGSDSDSGSDSNDFSDMWPNNPQDDPEDHTNSGNDQQGQNGGGGSTGGGSNGTGSNNGNSSGEPEEGNSIHDVLSSNQFHGYKESEKRECLKRCTEMLKEVKCELNGKEILMAHYESVNHRATTAVNNYNEGINYIVDQLNMGHPVVVGVDYKKGHSTGDTRADQAADHFVVIVGQNSDGSFHYYDPNTANQSRGTSDSNVFTLEDNLLKSVNVSSGSTHNYIVTSIRTNK
jgi:hypothetical protein